MPSCLSGYFAVMLRQAALAVQVAYQKSTLPSPRPCLPCLTSKYPRQAGPRLFCRDAASGSTCGSGRVPEEYAPITAPLPSLPDVKISATGSVGLFCRDAVSGSACGSGRQRHRRCIPAVKQLFLSACLRKAKPLFFSKPGLCQRGRSPSMILSGGFSGTSPRCCLRGRGVRKTVRKSARYQANSGN